MKTLVHNYSSEITSEPLYINQALSTVGVTSKLWNNECSAFDIFDTFDPDVFITHFRIITQDMIKRLSDSNVKVIINASGADDETIVKLRNLGFEAQLFQETPTSKDNIPVIGPCADTFLQLRNVEPPQYECETLYLIIDEEGAKSSQKDATEDSYHVITPLRALFNLKEVDGSVPISNLYSIYKNYKKIVCFTDSQLQYDAAYYGGLCWTKPNEFLTKSDILDRYTPFHATSKLMELINQKEISEKLNEQIRTIS